MSKLVLKITLKNWEKHNGNKKRNHRYFMLENRFFEDSKISQLKQIEVLIFIKCLSIAGELNASSFQIHAGLMPRRWRVDDKLMLNSCKSLESFQLLTAEIGNSLIIEKKRREDNIIIAIDQKFSEKMNPTQKFDIAMKLSTDVEGKKFVEFFREQTKLKPLEKFLPEIFSHFGNFENFLLCYDGILNSKSYENISNSADKFKYFKVSLLKEIGR